jgi:hypothetical protein
MATMGRRTKKVATDQLSVTGSAGEGAW